MNFSSSPFVPLRASIEEHVYDVKCSLSETVQRACDSALVRHLSQIYEIEEGVALTEVQAGNVQVGNVEVEGTFLNKRKTIWEENVFMGSVLKITLKMTSDFKSNLPKKCLKARTMPSDEYPNQESETQKTVFSANEILAATENYSKANILGKGGQAIVYKGMLFGKPVAVKKYLSSNVIMREKETTLLRKFRHSNVLHLFGWCPEENCTVTEYMSGGSLQDCLEDKGLVTPLTWAARYHVVHQIVSAIDVLHRHNVLHRDLKPANILLDSHGTIKVADLGQAKMVESSSHSSKSIYGTLGYVDPFFALEPAASTAMDIYSLGLIILQLCAHQPKIQMIQSVICKIKGTRKSSMDGIMALKPLLAAGDGTLPAACMNDMLEIGLQCVETDPRNRPEMSTLLERFSKQSSYSDLGCKMKYDQASRPSSQRVMDRNLSFNMTVLEKQTRVVYDLVTNAEAGNPESQFRLGQLYANGDQLAQDRMKAVEWYNEAAKQGHGCAAEALHKLFDSTYETIKFSEFREKSVHFLKVCGKKAIPPAQYFLAHCYYWGYGVKEDENKAKLLYKRVVDWDFNASGDTWAQFRIGECHFFGRGVKLNRERAFKYYLKAAKKGNPHALHKVAECFFDGSGTSMDKVKAVEWYTLSAQKGNGDSQLKLGMCYFYGWGTAEDKSLALEWYTKAAQQGVDQANHMLAKACRYQKKTENILL